MNKKPYFCMKVCSNENNKKITFNINAARLSVRTRTD